MRRLTLLVVFVAFVFSCGGQWPLLQVVAWGNMIREYSQMVPLSQAVEMTFSGKYPCALCQAIAEKKDSENAKLLAVFKYEKLILPSSDAVVNRAVEASPQEFVFRGSSFSTRSEAPPTPPPRCA
jgi:hypothetical protein